MSLSGFLGSFPRCFSNSWRLKNAKCSFSCLSCSASCFFCSCSKRNSLNSRCWLNFSCSSRLFKNAWCSSSLSKLFFNLTTCSLNSFSRFGWLYSLIISKYGFARCWTSSSVFLVSDSSFFNFLVWLASAFARSNRGPISVSYTHLTLPTSDLV